MKTVLTTTSSFAQEDPSVLKTLENQGFKVVLNPHARALNTQELLTLLNDLKPVGLLAGTEKINAEVLTSAKSYLKVVSRVGTGWDNVDRPKAEELGIKVFRTPDAVTDAVVELTIALFFDLARKVSSMDRQLRQGLWKKQMGVLLQGRTLGVVGCGRIGKSVALKMRSLGVNVVGFDPFEESWFTSENVKRYTDLNQLIADVDLLSIHVPGSKTPLINAENLKLAKSHLLLVNVSRGDVIDESALVEALKTKKIAGAGLDVFQTEPYLGPLQTLDNVVLTPHIGSYATEARVRMEVEAVENLLKGLALG